jgi:hypothetical protein
MANVVLEICLHATDGGIERPNAAMTGWAAHFLVGIAFQSVVNRDADPFAPCFQFAGIVADCGHGADI